MRNQVWYVALLIGIMGLIRLGLAAIGYINPPWLMEQLGAPAAANLQMPYILRVWAIRDIVLAILVLTANPNTIKPLLLACIAIDCTDVLSAFFSGMTGLFNPDDTRSLQLTAIAALIPETIALGCILHHNPQGEE